MDSVSQAALGAAVGVVVMGRSRPVWQSALAGALVGTLPDLDVFIDQGDAVRNMVLHRAETHALFWQALATPLIALGLALATFSRHLTLRWNVMVLLSLFTHAVLDAMTVYGTRIGLPFTDHPFGLGSLFIIDPLYTIPLVLGVLLALLLRQQNRRRWAAAGLAVSTLYAGWSVAAQAHVTSVVLASPEARGLTKDAVLVTPTPFNTVLWRVVLLRDGRYAEGFYSLLDPLLATDSRLRFDWHTRGMQHDDIAAQFPTADLVRQFSKGFYALSMEDQRLVITDLRMGLNPYYAFAFAFAERTAPHWDAIEPIRYARRTPLREGVAWLRQRALGDDVRPPSQALGLADMAGVATTR